jgi:phage-related protein
LSTFPQEVRVSIGHALHEAQCGGEPISAKALKGFGGRGVPVRFAHAIYALHAFQKKSKKGVATPKHKN